MEEKINQAKSEAIVDKGGKKDCSKSKDGGVMKNLGISLIITVCVTISMFFGVLMGIIIHRDYVANDSTSIEAGASLVTVALADTDGGEWEFAVADGTVVEYIGKSNEQVKVDTSNSDENAETETRSTFFFRGVKEGETTITMNYRKDGGITETKVYKVSVNSDLAATTTVEK